MKHTRYAWLTVSALLVAVVIAGGMTYSAQAGIGSTLAKVVGKVTGKVAGTSTKTRCLNGEVTSLSRRAMTVRYADARGRIIHRVFRLGAAQYTAAINRSIMRGTDVRACWKGGSGQGPVNLSGRVLRRSPITNAGRGNEDGGGGGSGGSSSGGGS